MINSRFGSYYKGNLPSPSGGGGWIPLAAAGVGAIADFFTQKKSRKQSRKMEQEARDWNKSMWDEINQYNHPIQQMARLKEAGLNPNLIYGSSPGSAVGNAGQIHPGKAPEQPYSDFISPAIALGQDVTVKQAQSNNLKSQALYNNMQAAKVAEETGMTKIQKHILENTVDETIGMTHLAYKIKGIEEQVARGTAPWTIANSQTMAKKNELAALILNKDLEMAQAGFVKGNYIGTIMKSVFNLDMSKPQDRTVAQAIAGAILGSQIAGNLTSSLKNAMQAFTKKKNK